VNYQPRPIKTEGVALPAESVPLTERLAEKANDLRGTQRLPQGWCFGSQRDDSEELHPCLVHCAHLPESEKQYDRIAAVGTLKAILKLTYRIGSATIH
jgi:ryanodine receptor 2